MVIVFITIGVTDLIFAIDSIPAIFEITTNGFLVFAANIFALMGLRQLYFLLGDLLDRLRYLHYGIAGDPRLHRHQADPARAACTSTSCRSINGGQHVEWVPDISNMVSLGVILASMTIATVASLIASSREKRASRPTTTVE